MTKIKLTKEEVLLSISKKVGWRSLFGQTSKDFKEGLELEKIIENNFSKILKNNTKDTLIVFLLDLTEDNRIEMRRSVVDKLLENAKIKTR